MNKEIPEQVAAEPGDEMRPEYDFASMPGGVRGKYHQDYRAGHAVKIHKADGTTVVQYFALEDGAVMLDPDVRKYFPDSEAVNNALRSLIALIPCTGKAVIRTKTGS
jgi:hypothetical protein